MEVSKFKSFVSEQLLCREVCALKLSLKAPVIISSGMLPLEEHNGPCLCSFASDPPDYCLLLSREICFLFPFLFDAQLTKCPYLNKKKAFQLYLVKPRSLFHTVNVTPQLNLNRLGLGRARRLMPMGGTSSLQGKCC